MYVPPTQIHVNDPFGAAMYNAIQLASQAYFDAKYVNAYPYEFDGGATAIDPVIMRASESGMRIFVIVAFKQDVEHIVKKMKSEKMLRKERNTLLIWDASVSLGQLKSLSTELQPVLAGSVLIYANYM